jgi:uncharacterized protein YraI
VLSLRVGPSELYDLIGLVPAGAPLEVVGRSEDGEWLAVAVAPGSTLYAWLPAGGVQNGPLVSTLPVQPVVEVPTR